MPASTVVPSRPTDTVATRVPSPVRTNASGAGVPGASIAPPGVLADVDRRAVDLVELEEMPASAARTPRASRRAAPRRTRTRCSSSCPSRRRRRCRRPCGPPSKSPSRATAIVRSRSSWRVRAATDPDQADGGLAVAVRAELDHRGSFLAESAASRQLRVAVDGDVDDRVERTMDLGVAVRVEGGGHPGEELRARSAGHEDTVAEAEACLVGALSRSSSAATRSPLAASAARWRRPRGRSPAPRTQLRDRRRVAPRAADARRPARSARAPASRGRSPAPRRRAVLARERAGPASLAEEPRRALERAARRARRSMPLSRRRRPDRGRHQPPASRMNRCRIRAATIRRYSAVERTSSIGESSPASVSAARSAVSGVGARALERASVARARIGVAATDPRATRTSRHARGAADVAPGRAPCTTLLIACARRVPTFRNRISRPVANGMRMRRTSSSGASAVRRYAGPELVGGDLALAARRRGRTRHRPRAGRAACRRPARRSRCCHRACRGSGSGPRRSSRRPPRAPARARGTAPNAGSPCTS